MATKNDGTQPGKQPGDTARLGTKAPAGPGQAGRDKDRDELRRELKSGRFDPGAQQSHEVRRHPTEGERMQLGDAAPGAAPDDDTILPDRGRPVPESLRRDSDYGVFDPPEPGHPLPEGLVRKRAAPLNKSTGRRIRGGSGR